MQDKTWISFVVHAKCKKLRYTAEVARIGGHYRFKVIQGHRFGDFGTNRKLICSFVLVIILTYILSFTVSKLFKIIGLICAFDGATSFNTIVRGERLNSEPRNLASKSRNIALCVVQNAFRYLEPFRHGLRA